MHNPPHIPDPEFNDIISGGYGMQPQPAFTDPAPYGIPPNSTAVKTGLTPRGKAALVFGATVIAGSSLLGWQHYSAQQATAEAKVQEIALKQAELRLEELRELNKVTTAQQETLNAADEKRQKKVDTCVNANKDLVGKQLGVTYRSVLEDCQAQYPATTNSSDMQAVATTGAGTDGGINTGLLIGGGVLAVGLAIAVKRSTKPTPA